MKELIYQSKNQYGEIIAQAWLTTEVPECRYGMPVLQIEHHGEMSVYGWADELPSGLTGLEFLRQAPESDTNYVALSPAVRVLIRDAIGNAEAMGL